MTVKEKKMKKVRGLILPGDYTANHVLNGAVSRQMKKWSLCAQGSG
jgi:hypothetical protein